MFRKVCFIGYTKKLAEVLKTKGENVFLLDLEKWLVKPLEKSE